MQRRTCAPPCGRRWRNVQSALFTNRAHALRNVREFGPKTSTFHEPYARFVKRMVAYTALAFDSCPPDV